MPVYKCGTEKRTLEPRRATVTITVEGTGASFLDIFYSPMARVMTFSLFRTSLITMLFCSGVERQQSTDRQLRATARNLSSKLLSRA